MTFNRYIGLRMVIELVGAAACATQLYRENGPVNLIITAVVALVWVCGEIWVVLIYNRENPRSDELSDQHQMVASRFALLVTVGALMVIGFAGMIYGMATHDFITVTPASLPMLAMLALALADARYLWLEHRDGAGYDDEDDE